MDHFHRAIPIKSSLSEQTQRLGVIEDTRAEHIADLHPAIDDRPVVGVDVARVRAQHLEALGWLFQHPLRVHEIPQHLQIRVSSPLDNRAHRCRAAPIVVRFQQQRHAAFSRRRQHLRKAFHHVIDDRSPLAAPVALAAKNPHQTTAQISR